VVFEGHTKSHLIHCQEFGVHFHGTLLITSPTNSLVCSQIIIVVGAMLSPNVGPLLSSARLLVVS